MLTGNQGGKALKWLPAHFNFARKICLLFRECVHKFGTFCPEVRRRTRDGAFIYALSADETSPALAVAAVCVVCAMLICKAVKKNLSKKTAAVIGAAAFAGAVLAVIVIARTPMPL